MSEIARPRLLSDFDGTALETVPKTNPRNWTKYPLAMVNGYLHFLGGVQSAGVEVASIVSRRPNILPRKLATMRSVGKLGMREFFQDDKQIVLAGSEKKKAQVVAREADSATVGFVDDKPNVFGIALINALNANKPEETFRSIVLGAVEVTGKWAKLRELAERAALIDGVSVNTGMGRQLLICDEASSFRVQVVPLRPFDEIDVGFNFGKTIIEAQSAN